MSKPRVIVTRKIPDDVETLLRRHFTVALNPADEPFSTERLITAMQAADGLLCTVTDKISDEVIKAGGARKTQIIANFGVGYSNIDTAAAKAAEVVVTNTPDVLTDATADIALSLMLNVTRRTWEMENMLRQGKWSGFSLVKDLGTGLQGKVLGIIGMGRIGEAVAKRAEAFGMEVIFYNRSRKKSKDVAAVQVDSVDTLLAQADVVSLHCPGGDENRHLINAERIEKMKPTAFIINTARGEVIDERALTEALAAGRIAGAGLDVFENEPHVTDRLRRLDNVCLYPHIGSATIETRTAMGMLAAENLIAHFGSGEYPSRVV